MLRDNACICSWRKSVWDYEHFVLTIGFAWCCSILHHCSVTKHKHFSHRESGCNKKLIKCWLWWITHLRQDRICQQPLKAAAACSYSITRQKVFAFNEMKCKIQPDPLVETNDSQTLCDSLRCALEIRRVVMVFKLFGIIRGTAWCITFMRYSVLQQLITLMTASE